MISSPDKLDLDYVAHFDKQLLGVVEDAIAAMRPAAISLVEDTCDVAVNRRRTVNGRTSNAPNPDGPVDRAVQVLAFRDPDTQKPFGLLVKYACHPVTTSMFAVGSSYPGLMMDTLQARHAGLTVQFLQGCSGDCRPALIGEDPTKFIPGTLDLAKSFGTRLADAVDRALAKPGRQIKGPIDTRYTQIDLPIRPVERPEFAAAANSNAWHIQRWGQKYLAQLDAGRPLDTKVPFRIQAVRLGQAPDAACLIVAFDGEIFAGYSHHIQKRLAPTPTIALGYANAMAGYIPTAEAFPKGGYEVNAYPVWDHPGPFLPSIESQILKTAQSLAQSLLP